MTAIVILCLTCDAFRGESKPRKKCDGRADFEAPNIVACKNNAWDAGWAFVLKNAKDKIYCPKCGPKEAPHLYKQK